MPVQMEFPYLKAINHHLSSMEETGLLTKLRNKWLHTRELTKEHICQNAKTGNKDMSGYDTVEWGNVHGFTMVTGTLHSLVTCSVFERFPAQLLL